MALRALIEGQMKGRKKTTTSPKGFAAYLNGLTPAQRIEALWELNTEILFCWDCGKDGCGGSCV